MQQINEIRTDLAESANKRINDLRMEINAEPIPAVINDGFAEPEVAASPQTVNIVPTPRPPAPMKGLVDFKKGLMVIEEEFENGELLSLLVQTLLVQPRQLLQPH